MRTQRKQVVLIIFLLFLVLVFSSFSPVREREKLLDDRVQSFLAKMEYRWRDMNVPKEDGKILYDIVLKNGYRRALEIGTSTGHSAVWIAWALSKTGGKLITIEINRERYEEALANFKEAGLDEYIDARLADAHQLTEKLPGPFDFVFIDADKDWYVNYAKVVIPKIEEGGCIAAHNVYEGRSGWRRGGRGVMGREYYEFMRNLHEFETQVLPESRHGLCVSFKKK